MRTGKPLWLGLGFVPIAELVGRCSVPWLLAAESSTGTARLYHDQATRNAEILDGLRYDSNLNLSARPRQTSQPPQPTTLILLKPPLPTFRPPIPVFPPLTTLVLALPCSPSAVGSTIQARVSRRRRRGHLGVGRTGSYARRRAGGTAAPCHVCTHASMTRCKA